MTTTRGAGSGSGSTGGRTAGRARRISAVPASGISIAPNASTAACNATEAASPTASAGRCPEPFMAISNPWWRSADG